MVRVILVAWVLALSACAGVAPPVADTQSACFANEASYACQVERYNNVNVQ